jgi:hypothetical protein
VPFPGVTDVNKFYKSDMFKKRMTDEYYQMQTQDEQWLKYPQVAPHSTSSL